MWWRRSSLLVVLVCNSGQKDGLNSYVFYLAEGEKLALALIYLGSLYARLESAWERDQIVGKLRRGDPRGLQFPSDVHLGALLDGGSQPN